MNLEINWLAVVVASLSSFIIGAVWFGPKTFYPIWMKALRGTMPTEPTKMTGAETGLMFGGTYLAALIQVATLGFAFEFIAAATPGFGALDGALYGFLLSVGLTAFGSLSHRMFGQPEGRVFRSLKVWLIEVGQDVLALTVAGAILGAWT
jgi:hypothetical protein